MRTLAIGVLLLGGILVYRSDPAESLLAPPPALARRPPMSEVVKVHGGGWLVARAPIAQEELEALVEQAGTR